MNEELVSKLAPGLRRLGEGGYERAYVGRGKVQRTSTHQLVADLLDLLRVRYSEDVEVSGRTRLRADFLVNGVWVFVDRHLGAAELKALGSRKKDCIVIERERNRSDRFDHGIRVLGLEEEGAVQTIFLDDPSFNFDYAHILPRTLKCSVMHGHTSSILVEIIGRPVDGMVVDFGVAKRVVREAVGSLDHKLFINEKYVTAMDEESVALQFETVHGAFAIRAPKQTTVTLEGEATVENLAKEALGKIAPRMPPNVTAVGVYVYEGLNKGSYILTKLHQGGAKGRRRHR